MRLGLLDNRGRLDVEVAASLAVLCRAGAEFYGWINEGDKTKGVLAAAIGREAVLAIRDGDDGDGHPDPPGVPADGAGRPAPGRAPGPRRGRSTSCARTARRRRPPTHGGRRRHAARAAGGADRAADHGAAHHRRRRTVRRDPRPHGAAAAGAGPPPLRRHRDRPLAEPHDQRRQTASSACWSPRPPRADLAAACRRCTATCSADGCAVSSAGAGPPAHRPAEPSSARCCASRTPVGDMPTASAVSSVDRPTTVRRITMSRWVAGSASNGWSASAPRGSRRRR